MPTCFDAAAVLERERIWGAAREYAVQYGAAGCARHPDVSGSWNCAAAKHAGHLCPFKQPGRGARRAGGRRVSSWWTAHGLVLQRLADRGSLRNFADLGVWRIEKRGLAVR